MRSSRTPTIAALAAVLCAGGAFAADDPRTREPAVSTTTGRVASVYLSETFINELLRENLRTDLLTDVVVELDAKKEQIVASGVLKIPTEGLRAVNLEKDAGDFRFQVAIKPKTTRRGHLLLVFPLNETFFYPADSKRPEHDKVVVPVQMLSLALASARGRLAVLSGDFSGFDRKTAELKERLAGLKRRLGTERDPERRMELEHERKRAELELEAIPLERRQGEKLAKSMERFLGFVGERELDLNQELSARRNALIVRIKVGQLAPYLKGIELGGVRILREKKSDSPTSFLAVDVDADLAEATPRAVRKPSGKRSGKPSPRVAIRLNQALFESKALLNAEKAQLGERLRDLSLSFKDDGAHVQGYWRLPLLPDLRFSSTLDFVWTAPNVFEIRVRELKVAYIEMAPLTNLLLSAVKRRLDESLKGACAFEYIGQSTDGSRAMRATVDMARLLPAFPQMLLMDIDIKENELILKAGK